MQGVFPLEGSSKQNPGGNSQVAEAKVATPTVKRVFPLGGFPVKNPSGNMPSTDKGKRLSFMECVKKVLQFPASPISLPPFQCKLTADAAEQNLKLLSQHDGSIGKVIEQAAFSPMSIGSEFKPPDVLEPILANHPSWPQLKDSLLHGASCPIREMDDDTMQRDFDIALQRGNCKSATEEGEWIAEQFHEKGWTLALPLHASISTLPKSNSCPTTSLII